MDLRVNDHHSDWLSLDVFVESPLKTGHLGVGHVR
jgi:hypothetical protein